MSTSYIPAKNVDFDVWFANFVAILAATPAAYGLIAADVTPATAAYNTWHASYLLSTNPSTRTPVTVAQAVIDKASGLAVARPLAQRIQANAGVTDDAKAAAGLTIRDPGRTVIPTPTTIPVLGIICNHPLETDLSYRDNATPTSKAKPFGASAAEIWRVYSETVPSGPEAYSFVNVQTKSPFSMDHDADKVGKKFWVISRWTTATGKQGPWSAAVSSTVVGT